MLERKKVCEYKECAKIIWKQTVPGEYLISEPFLTYYRSLIEAQAMHKS